MRAHDEPRSCAPASDLAARRGAACPESELLAPGTAFRAPQQHHLTMSRQLSSCPSFHPRTVPMVPVLSFHKPKSRGSPTPTYRAGVPCGTSSPDAVSSPRPANPAPGLRPPVEPLSSNLSALPAASTHPGAHAPPPATWA